MRPVQIKKNIIIHECDQSSRHVYLHESVQIWQDDETW